jgi:hypothetical protein
VSVFDVVEEVVDEVVVLVSVVGKLEDEVLAVVVVSVFDVVEEVVDVLVFVMEVVDVDPDVDDMVVCELFVVEVLVLVMDVFDVVVELEEEELV